MELSCAHLHLITQYPEEEIGPALYGSIAHDAMEVESGLDEVEGLSVPYISITIINASNINEKMAFVLGETNATLLYHFLSAHITK